MSDHKFIAYCKNLMLKFGHANGQKQHFQK